MKIESLWYEAVPLGRTNRVDVRLRRCPNCGEVKVLSRPCGFDHLAALIELENHMLGDAATAAADAGGHVQADSEGTA